MNMNNIHYSTALLTNRKFSKLYLDETELKSVELAWTATPCGEVNSISTNKVSGLWLQHCNLKNPNNIWLFKGFQCFHVKCPAGPDSLSNGKT